MSSEIIKKYGLDSWECTEKAEEIYINHKIYHSVKKWTKGDECILLTKRDSLIWLKNDKIHREGGPALIPGVDSIKYGTAEYWRDGELIKKVKYNEIKEEYSTIRFAGISGYWTTDKVWYEDGKYHRVDGPAIITDGKTEIWMKEGKLHREGAPAIKMGDLEWWAQDGELHREDGPAHIYYDDEKKYFLRGKEYPKDKFYNLIDQIKKIKKIYPEFKGIYIGSEIKRIGGTEREVDIWEWEGKKYLIGGSVWIEEDGLYCKLQRERHLTKSWFNSVELIKECMECSDGSKYQYWYKEGNLHRDEDLPAMELSNGDKHWYKEGKTHREGDKPAIEFANGIKKWYKEDKLHREGGPAVIRFNEEEEYWIEGKKLSKKEWEEREAVSHKIEDKYIEFSDGAIDFSCYAKEVWYKDGKYHRDDGPAIITTAGSEIWMKDGVVHREGAPAIISGAVSRWIKNGKLHREDGPAYIEGSIEGYYLEGKNLSLEEWKKEKRHKKFEEPKRITFNLKEYSHADAMEIWYEDDECKIIGREDGPAIKEKDGELWLKNGKVHREGGPAATFNTNIGLKSLWYKEGKVHREDGPAIIEGSKDRYFLDDVFLTKEQWEAKMAVKNMANESERRRIAACPETTKEILAELSKDEDANVRFYVALNPNCPAEVLVNLSKDTNYDVRYNVARNPNCPVEVLQELSKDEDADVRYYVARNPNCPVEILVNLSKDEDSSVRRHVVGNPNCPVEGLAELSKDTDWNVRYNVARNPNCPADILVELSKDENSDVRYNVAVNPNCPAEVLVNLSKDEDYHVRYNVIKNHNCPVEILVNLSKDKNASVRWNVAQNPNCPDEVLEELSKDENYIVRWNVAKNPNCPTEVLQELSKDTDADVRWNIAANPNCPAEVLVELSKDKNISVSTSAKANLSDRKCKEEKETNKFVKVNNGTFGINAEEVWYQDKEHKIIGRENEPAIISCANKYWIKDNNLHRENDKPAIEYINGEKQWFKDGKLHRETGPAKICENIEQFYLEDKLLTKEEWERQTLEKRRKATNVSVTIPRDTEEDINIVADEVWYEDDAKTMIGRVDGPAVLSYRREYWLKAGLLHRDGDLPAALNSGYKSWWKNGKRHRENGPAQEFISGAQKYWLDGIEYSEENWKKEIFKRKHCVMGRTQFHANGFIINSEETWYEDEEHKIIGREDGPAAKGNNGDLIWLKNGKLHREEDKPAIEYASGAKEWFKDGKRHREDGPAIEDGGNQPRYYLEGQQLTKEQWEKEIFKLKHHKTGVTAAINGFYFCNAEVWYNDDGKIGRDDEPAIKNRHYTIWARNGNIHKDGDLPAIEWLNSGKQWWKNGKRHRETGPAVIWDGQETYWLDGKQLTKEEWEVERKIVKKEKFAFAGYFLENATIYYQDVEKTIIGREDGPAIVSDNTTIYVKDGIIHRDDNKPAIEVNINYLYGRQEWRKEGKLHREGDLPAIEHVNGSKEWYKDGDLHRDGGPAIDHIDGTQQWLKHNKFHREDGPAYITQNGMEQFWIDGKKLTPFEFNKYTRTKFDKVKNRLLINTAWNGVAGGFGVGSNFAKLGIGCLMAGHENERVKDVGEELRRDAISNIGNEFIEKIVEGIKEVTKEVTKEVELLEKEEKDAEPDYITIELQQFKSA